MSEHLQHLVFRKCIDFMSFKVKSHYHTYKAMNCTHLCVNKIFNQVSKKKKKSKVLMVVTVMYD